MEEAARGHSFPKMKRLPGLAGDPCGARMARVSSAAVRPEWVFTLHPSDLNVDHRVCYEATMAAVRLPQRLSAGLPVTMIRKVLLCEVLSSTDWSLPAGPQFHPNTFFDVSRSFDRKIE